MINAAPLNVYLILHCHLVFCTEIYLFEVLYFSEYHIWMFLYVFTLRKGPCIKYVRNWWWWGEGVGAGEWDGGVIQNAYVHLRIGGRGFHNFWISEVKQYEETMSKQSQNGRRGIKSLK